MPTPWPKVRDVGFITNDTRECRLVRSTNASNLCRSTTDTHRMRSLECISVSTTYLVTARAHKAG